MSVEAVKKTITPERATGLVTTILFIASHAEDIHSLRVIHSPDFQGTTSITEKVFEAPGGITVKQEHVDSHESESEAGTKGVSKTEYLTVEDGDDTVFSAADWIPPGISIPSLLGVPAGDYNVGLYVAGGWEETLETVKERLNTKPIASSSVS